MATPFPPEAIDILGEKSIHPSEGKVERERLEWWREGGSGDPSLSRHRSPFTVQGHHHFGQSRRSLSPAITRSLFLRSLAVHRRENLFRKQVVWAFQNLVPEREQLHLTTVTIIIFILLQGSS